MKTLKVSTREATKTFIISANEWEWEIIKFSTIFSRFSLAHSNQAGKARTASSALSMKRGELRACSREQREVIYSLFTTNSNLTYASSCMRWAAHHRIHPHTHTRHPRARIIHSSSTRLSDNRIRWSVKIVCEMRNACKYNLQSRTKWNIWTLTGELMAYCTQRERSWTRRVFEEPQHATPRLRPSQTNKKFNIIY